MITTQLMVQLIPIKKGKPHLRVLDKCVFTKNDVMLSLFVYYILSSELIEKS